MAQLNPNFEIDFSDINSYEQIQLINDTQLAKENLLMHRAYKEPSDDEIIRNHFSSFTFVDFCPKLLPSAQRASKVGLDQQQQQVSERFNSSSNDRAQLPTNSPLPMPPASSLRTYDLETFSDLFERINSWLKLNKDWRVVSMETLVYDCTSQFNHLKSSIHSTHLPQNTRGLRLFLSPSKSRFSGPQKIGCINVVPRKVTGSHLSLSTNDVQTTHQTSQQQETVTYETLDDILQRLNELLLTRPIEGRILSVETINLPMVNGYVNTESNYYVDSRLNSLSQSAYNLAASHPRRRSSAQSSTVTMDSGGQQQASGGILIADPSLHGHTLIDILRVYYEFGPMVCGLVNLIDFVPRFYTPTPVQQAAAAEPQSINPSSGDNNRQPVAGRAETSGGGGGKPREKIAATESLTRLIRRSLAWFETERKRILSETGAVHHSNDHQSKTGANLDPTSSSSSTDSSSSGDDGSNNKKNAVNLKLCNLQVHHKTLLKSQLVQMNTHSSGNGGSLNNVAQILSTRTMVHPQPSSQQPLSCAQCNLSTDKSPIQNWCLHLNDLSQAYQVKFVRLAYIVPVFNKYARPACPLRPFRCNRQQAAANAGSGAAPDNQTATVTAASGRQTPATAGHPSSDSGSLSSSATNNSASSTASPFLLSKKRRIQTAGELAISDLQVQATIDWPADELSQPNGQVVTTDDQERQSPPPIPTLGPNQSGPGDNRSVATPTATATTAHVRSESGGSIASSSSSSSSAGKNSSSSSRSDAPAHFDDEDEHRLKEFLLNQGKEEESAKQGALEIVRKTNERHQKDEQAHQLKQRRDDSLNDSPIGQLTYRLFAPCQLVNSSSCFSINPVNSSSPLARRGSVDLNGSGISSENANPSTLLLGNSSSASSSSFQHNESSLSSFGAFFPNLAHDFMHPSGAGGTVTAASSGLGCSDVSQSSNLKSSSSAAAASSSSSLSSSGQLSANSRFTTNEFEPVNAIKRRMEIYVTTNSMKVVAGETLIVNLSDVLSCLSTAIEQTVVKAPFAQRAPSTWVSVYVLYAAVEEPQLPSQLLAQQRLRDLTLIDEETGEEEKAAAVATATSDKMTAECYFDDDFKGSLDISGPSATTTTSTNEQKGQHKATAVTKSESSSTTATKIGSSIRIEQNLVDSSLTLYNSAYDRTVALPTPPDNQQGELVKPTEFLGSCLWLNESDLIEAQTRQYQQATTISQLEAGRKARKGKKAKSRKHDDSQCSIM